MAHRPDEAAGEYYDPLQGTPGFLEARRVASDHWRVYPETIPGQEWPTTRYRFVTPKGELSMVLQSQRAHLLGHRAPDQGEARHRPDRRIHARAQVRRGGGQS